MIWAELHKVVNSNLAVPLNEQVNRGVKNYKYLKAINTSDIFVTDGEYHTLLEVQGRGRLYGAIIKNYIEEHSEDFLEMKVTVDNNVIFNVKGVCKKNSTTGYSNYVGIVDENLIKFTGNMNLFGCIKINNNYSYDEIEVDMSENLIEEKFQTYDDKGILCKLNGYVRFEKSLKIEYRVVETVNKKQGYVIKYDLDD